MVADVDRMNLYFYRNSNKATVAVAMVVMVDVAVVGYKIIDEKVSWPAHEVADLPFQARLVRLFLNFYSKYY